MDQSAPVCVGIVQEAAPHLNLPKALEKLKVWMDRAADENVNLLVFGEGWLSGYPVWFDYVPKAALWDYPPTKKLFQRFRANSIAVDGPEMQQVRKWAAERQLVVGLGFNERVDQQAGHGTVYNSIALIDQDGTLVNHHRKLCPTFTEKLVHGPGDGRGLQSVPTGIGQLGGLICWEHWMPLSRQALHETGEQVHLAMWPKVHEMHQVASRQYAFEGRCFVIAAGQLFRVSDMPEELELPEELAKDPNHLLMDGGSCVIGPNGKYVLEPDFSGAPWLTCSFDPAVAVEEQMTLDVTGHYSRPDIFQFEVDRSKR